MLEFKIVPCYILGKPKLALCLWSIQAEPDAKLGIWAGEREDDWYIITVSLDEAIKAIHKLNGGYLCFHPVSPKIREFLNPNKIIAEI